MRIAARLLGVLSAGTAISALADIPTDPTQVRPLSVGSAAPPFSGTTTDGKVRTFSPSAYKRPTIVIFYRGGWCPYCNMQLSDLRLVEPELRGQGFEVVFLSTDRPEILYASLKATDIHYTLLSDSNLEAANAFHIVYRLDAATVEMQKKYGVDLEKTSGTSLHQLPVPSVFIIDTTGTIRYVYSNPDYKIRLGADALMSAAKPYATAKTH